MKNVLRGFFRTFVWRSPLGHEHREDYSVSDLCDPQKGSGGWRLATWPNHHHDLQGDHLRCSQALKAVPLPQLPRRAAGWLV